MSGLTIAIIGAVIGVVGFFFFQNASETIAQGDLFFGLGWYFQDMPRETVILYRYGGITCIAVGGVMVIARLIRLVRNR